MTPVIEARALACGYDSVPFVPALDLEVNAGEIVALLGSNGAGKSTSLLTLGGDLAALSGEILWDGTVTKDPLFKRARRGMAFVTEERSVFMDLTVAENLRVGRVSEADALEMFPELEARMKVRAGLLSGGEQQMLTLARAIARSPRLLLADELSLGLAPLIIERLLKTLRRAADSGLAVILVEQHLRYALEVADRAYLMERGRVTLSGTAADLKERVAEIESSYLGSGSRGDLERTMSRDSSSAASSPLGMTGSAD
jgi:branched-chain amino acid transport system ATP-binding protein